MSETTINPQLRGAGSIIQVAINEVTTEFTSTVNISQTAAVPTSSEGVEILTIDFTPKSATNILLFEFQAGAATDRAPSGDGVALFKDSDANAIAARWCTAGSFAALGISNVQNINLLLRHSRVAGSTSTATYKIRVGPTAVTSGGLRINRYTTGSIWTGAATAIFTITEIAA